MGVPEGFACVDLSRRRKARAVSGGPHKVDVRNR